MRQRQFGRLGEVSALSLGGGGIGGTWGPTTRAESVATVLEAVDSGINLIDVAPAYGHGEAELVVRDAYGGHLPSGVRIATKCALLARWSPVRQELLSGPLTESALVSAIERSVTDSEARLGVERIDLLFLHDPFIAEGEQDQTQGITPGLYQDVVRPTFERLLDAGRIGAWGLSGTGRASVVTSVLDEGSPPHAVQIEANVLRSRSATGSSLSAPGATELIAVANRRDIPVMGIRPTESGALTSGFDRPTDEEAEAQFRRAAPFRELAGEIGISPAVLAHRYVLALPGLATVTLGVKNREELRAALNAESDGPLPPALIQRIEQAVSEPRSGTR